MKDTGAFIRHIIVSIILIGLTIPVIQKLTGIFPEVGLKGAIVAADKPALVVRSWFDATYQEKMEIYLNEFFGLRNYFVRFNNQIAFSLFRKARANGVIIGKQNYLFEENYIKAYYGEDFIGEDSVLHQVQRFKYVQDTLQKLNKQLVMVLAAGKGSYYPEYFPEKYKTLKGKTNYDYYARYAREYGVNCIDFNRYFLEFKTISPYPLYPRYGIHWSCYGAYKVIDSLIRYTEERVNYHFAEVTLNEIKWDSANDTDYDIADGMNLFFELERPQMAYPQFTITRDTSHSGPSLLVISDSFYWVLYGIGISKAFPMDHFWFYNKEIFPESFTSPTNTRNTSLRDEIAKHDVIIIMATEATLPSFGWGFIEDAFEVFAHNKPDNPVEPEDAFHKKVTNLINYIKTDEKWYLSVKKKAAKKGIPLDSMLMLDATWLIEQEAKKKDP
jgi:hypothetical protein